MVLLDSHPAWVRSLAERPGASVFRSGFSALELSWEGLTLAVTDSGRDGRFARAARRLWIRHVSGWSFDLGEWLHVVDGEEAGRYAGGASSLELLDGRMGTLTSAVNDPDVLGGLREAREHWQARAAPPVEELGSTFGLPRELKTICDELESHGFVGTGEGSEGEWGSSSVHRKGPVGVLAAIEHGVRSIAVSVRPHAGWHDLCAYSQRLASSPPLHPARRPDRETLFQGVEAAMPIDFASQLELLRAALPTLDLSLHEPSMAPISSMSRRWHRRFLNARDTTDGDPKALGVDVRRMEVQGFVANVIGDNRALNQVTRWLIAERDDESLPPSISTASGKGTPELCAGAWSGDGDLVMSTRVREAIQGLLTGWQWLTIEIDGDTRHLAFPPQRSIGSYVDLTRSPIATTKRGDRVLLRGHLHQARLDATAGSAITCRTAGTLARADLEACASRHEIPNLEFRPVWTPEL